MAMSGSSKSEAPLVIEDHASPSWDDAADVVIVGFGGAGVAAAIEARENGADVLAIDRFGGGGATHYSGGVYYAGGGTKYQREAGFDDTPEEMFKYLRAEGTPLTDETLRRFCEGSVAELEWVEAHGAPFGGNAYLKKTAYPPDPHYLYYSGNEAMPTFAALAKPAPRGHRPATAGFGGHLFYARLREAALAKGVRLLAHAPVERLIVDRDGRVVGVEVNELPEGLRQRHEELYAVVSPWKPLNAAKAQAAIEALAALEAQSPGRKRIRARGGVIIAAGGFVNNLEMLRAHRPLAAEKYLGIQRLGSAGCDGSGIRLGQSAGGAVGMMDRMFFGRSITPPDAFVYGLIVNARGERFVNEDAYNSIVGNAVAEQPEGIAWLIMDAKRFRLGLRQSLFPGKGMFVNWGLPALINIFLGGTKRAGSLAALARKCGIDPAGLEHTVMDHNARCAIKPAADPLGKAPDKLVPIAPGACYALNVSLSNKFSPTWAFTLGGLDVDQDSGLVRRADGSTIPGLYAAGRSAIGLCSVNYNMSGSSIADTVFSGRRAGRHAAHQAQTTARRAA